MRVFMLGWEFPPFISGGLGTACYGLTKAMSQLNIKVTFVLPKTIDGAYSTHVNVLSSDSLTHDSDMSGSNAPTASFKIDELTNVTFHTINSPLQPYEAANVYEQRIKKKLKQKQEMHVLKVDFWDVDEMANKIIAVLKYPPLKVTLQNHGNFEMGKLSWKDSAAKCIKIYEEVLASA